ncbi:hypothetical protein GQR58_019835 [Nymphon striatum]|nr:hypothetical protein GQR58_019835 [Nymphon striatum]
MKRRWKWIGDILRKESKDAKIALKWTPPGRRNKGRPRTTWTRMKCCWDESAEKLIGKLREEAKKIVPTICGFLQDYSTPCKRDNTFNLLSTSFASYPRRHLAFNLMEDGCSGQADLQPIPITNDLYQDSTPSQRGSYDKKHDCRIFLEETAPEYVDNVSPAEIDIRNTKEVFSSVEKGDLQNLWAEPRTFNENWTGFLNSKTKSELVMDIEHSTQNFQDQVKFLESQDRNSSPNPLSSTQTILKKTRKRVTIAEEHSSVDEEMVFFHPKRCKLPHQNEDELREVARNIVRNAMTEVQNRLDQSAMDFQEIDIAEERPVVFMPHLGKYKFYILLI